MTHICIYQLDRLYRYPTFITKNKIMSNTSCQLTTAVINKATRFKSDNVIKFVNNLRHVGVFFSGTPLSFTNKTVRVDISEILLNVALNTITLLYQPPQKTAGIPLTESEGRVCISNVVCLGLFCVK